MRAVLDPNVLISAILSPRGAPAAILRRWLEGDFEVVVSDTLLAELERALAYPKLRKRVAAPDAAAYVALVQSEASVKPDPAPTQTQRSPDPGDEYLIALAEANSAVIVTPDTDLLGLAGQLPIYAPAAFLALLGD